jgi:hypothetical protein
LHNAFVPLMPKITETGKVRTARIAVQPTRVTASGFRPVLLAGSGY